MTRHHTSIMMWTGTTLAENDLSHEIYVYNTTIFLPPSTVTVASVHKVGNNRRTTDTEDRVPQRT